MSGIEGLKILIVEDDRMFRKVMNVTLTVSGAVVFDAENGAEGLKTLGREKVDLVISDVQMPVMGGVEMLASIRKQDPKFPIVLFITGQSDLDQEESLRLGAAGLMHKPVKGDVLISVIEDLMTSGQLKKSAN